MSQKEGLSGAELIQKLEIISNLYQRTQQLQHKIDHFVPEDHYERTVTVPAFPGNYEDEAERTALEQAIDHEADNAIDAMTEVYKRTYEPKKPVEPAVVSRPVNEHACAKQNKQQLGFLLYGGGFTGVFALIFGGVQVIGLTIACAAAVAFYFWKASKAKQADEEATKTAIEMYEQNKVKKEEKYAQDMQTYQAEMSDFDEASQTFVRAYTEWRGIYLEHRREENAIAEKLEADRQAAVDAMNKEELLPTLQELKDTNDLVSTNYLPVLNTLIDLLKDGRADDLKEAINLYEDIAFRERKLALERQKEAQRRIDNERHHREQMEFLQDQERQRQREEYQRRQDAERQHREEMKERERLEQKRQSEERQRWEQDRRRAERAESDRKRAEEQATMRQCNTCALTSRCSVAFTRPNCASYRPR